MIDPKLAREVVRDFDRRLDEYMAEWEAALRRRCGKEGKGEAPGEDGEASSRRTLPG